MAYFAPYIDETGLHIPTYSDIMEYLEEQVRLIFGNDIYLGDDAQDYQLLSVFAAKLFDVMQLAELNYNNRSPATASGAALDTLVAINGLQRQPATASTATVTLTGTAGAVISRGAVQQVSTGYLWSLPASVTIGDDGTAEALATCQQLGPTVAVPGDLSIIATPTAGWVSVTNAAAADLGRAVETDAELRARQAQSVANPSRPSSRACRAVSPHSRACRWSRSTKTTPTRQIAMACRRTASRRWWRAVRTTTSPTRSTCARTTASAPMAQKARR